MEESKYYIPDISEFVQNFEFEILEGFSGRYDIFFTTGKPTITLTEYDYNEWTNNKVNWKHPVDEVITTPFGKGTFSYDGATANFFADLDDERIIKLLENGKIRARK